MKSSESGTARPPFKGIEGVDDIAVVREIEELARAAQLLILNGPADELNGHAVSPEDRQGIHLRKVLWNLAKINAWSAALIDRISPVDEIG